MQTKLTKSVNAGECPSGPVQRMLETASLPCDIFSPVVTRDAELPRKPDPEVAKSICGDWGLDPSEMGRGGG